MNLALIFRYVTLKKEKSQWWAPIVLNDIVLYFLMFGQMAQEYMTWGNKLLKWRQDLVFDQRYRSQDDSERNIRTNIESIIQQIEEEGLDVDNDTTKIRDALPVEEDQSVKKTKVLSINGNTYSLAYFALMKKLKKKHNMTTSDQFEILQKAMMILFVQLFFIYCIAIYGKIQFTMHNNVPLCFALIMTTLLLHVG
jgi:hypothetical protein